MTALTELQQKWAMNTEKKEITGILLQDLSAAFDCLDSEILCKKLEIYYSDAASIWNTAPESIKSAKSLHSAKMEIKKFITTLPI